MWRSLVGLILIFAVSVVLVVSAPVVAVVLMAIVRIYWGDIVAMHDCFNCVSPVVVAILVDIFNCVHR